MSARCNGTRLGISVLTTLAIAIQAQNTQNNSVETLAPRNVTEAQLISIAEAALRAENDILVNGDEIAALKRNPRALKAQTAFQKRFKKAKSRRTAMAQYGSVNRHY